MKNIKRVDSPRTTLVIRLGSHASDPIYWYAKIEGAENGKYGKLDHHTELKSISLWFNSDVRILIPASFVIFRRVRIKNKEILNNKKSLAFSIERSIISNIDDFHIVTLKVDSAFCYIAAIEHELMNVWLGWLKDAGISATAMIPDVLTLPFSDEEWFSIKLGNEWLIRNGDMSGFSIKEDIFEVLYRSKSLSLPENLLSHLDVQTLSSHSTHYCEVLRIMANNLEHNNVNLLSGRYYRHRKKIAHNTPVLRTGYLCFLLSIVMCLNSWLHNIDILRDIHMLNVVLQDFYTQYPVIKKYENTENINVHKGIYNIHMIDHDFIGFLHMSSEVFGKTDIAINSLVFDKEKNKISFNVTAPKGREINLALNEVDDENKRFSISKVINDNGTNDITFECCL
ncbi:general secretion pathway protein L [Yersinia kristensenii]|uniref:type II secretion system protein GspL n=1 Tax=Yersinia sp. Marseille-Q5920 TaxID=2972785 RepID=UPI0005E65745|nr:type II secretion system protein GspL [Yersinia sp. Marseille-Q5920]CNH79835.1 general secretion pathway protein L [Yersinia kristensenii]